MSWLSIKNADNSFTKSKNTSNAHNRLKPLLQHYQLCQSQILPWFWVTIGMHCNCYKCKLTKVAVFHEGASYKRLRKVNLSSPQEMSIFFNG